MMMPMRAARPTEPHAAPMPAFAPVLRPLLVLSWFPGAMLVEDEVAAMLVVAFAEVGREEIVLAEALVLLDCGAVTMGVQLAGWMAEKDLEG